MWAGCGMKLTQNYIRRYGREKANPPTSKRGFPTSQYPAARSVCWLCNDMNVIWYFDKGISRRVSCSKVNMVVADGLPHFWRQGISNQSCRPTPVGIRSIFIRVAPIWCTFLHTFQYLSNLQMLHTLVVALPAPLSIKGTMEMWQILIS